MICDEHRRPVRWEVNPTTGVKTKRCPKCGLVIVREKPSEGTELQNSAK